MIIDFENSKCTITKAEIDELFRLDTYEAFEKAVEDMVKPIPDWLMAITLFNYLNDMRGNE